MSRSHFCQRFLFGLHWLAIDSVKGRTNYSIGLWTQTEVFVLSDSLEEPGSVVCNMFTKVLECFNMIGLEQRNETKLRHHRITCFQKWTLRWFWVINTGSLYWCRELYIYSSADSTSVKSNDSPIIFLRRY